MAASGEMAQAAEFVGEQEDGVAEFLLNEIAHTFASAGHPDRAAHTIALYLSYNPDNVRTATVASRNLQALQQWSLVLPLFEQLTRTRPQVSVFHEAYCRTLFSLGRVDDCRGAYRRALDSSEHPVSFHLGGNFALSQETRSDLLAARANSQRQFTVDNASDVRLWKPDIVGGELVLHAVSNIPRNEIAETRFVIMTDGADGAGAAEMTVDSQPIAVADGGPWHWLERVPGLPAGATLDIRIEIAAQDGGVHAAEARFVMPSETPAYIENLVAEPVGLDGLSMSCHVGGTNLPTTYWFECGVSRTDLQPVSAPQPVPPARTIGTICRVVERLDEWMLYATEYQLVDDKTTVGNDDRSIRMRGPFGKDCNHVSGIGVFDLIAAWSPFQTTPQSTEEFNALPERDMRDAELTMTWRVPDGDACTFTPAAVIQGFCRTEDTKPTASGIPPYTTWVRFADSDQTDGAVRETRWTLSADASGWTYAGNNPVDDPSTIERFVYSPLADLLAHNKGNICFMLADPDWRHLPGDSIDLQEVSMRFRNWSVLGQQGLAELTEFPSTSLDDPRELTSGMIGDVRRMWFSAENPEQAQTFAWRFHNPVSISRLRLHQNVLAPARRVEIECVDKSGREETIWQGEMPDADADALWPNPMDISGEWRDTVELRLSICSGYRERWGLDAFEVLAGDITPVPEVHPASVAAEIGGLDPGADVFLRIVAENAAGRAESEILRVTLPADRTSEIVGATVERGPAGSVRVRANIRPRGLSTQVDVSIIDQQGTSHEHDSFDAGSNDTPRQLVFVVDGPEVEGDAFLVMTPRNEAGAGEACRLSLNNHKRS